MSRRIIFSISLLLFTVSAAFGFWTAYDTAAFTSRFVVLVVGVALALMVTWLPSWRAVRGAMMLTALLGLALTLRFFLLNDWSSAMWALRGSKLALFDGVFQRLSSAMPSALSVAVEPDVAGGVAAAALPFVVWCLLQAMRVRKRNLIVFWAAGGAALVLMLFVSLSYGAWLAAIVALATWAGWRLGGRALLTRGVNPERTWRVRLTAAVVLFAIGLVAYIGLVSMPALQGLPVIGGIAERAARWKDAMPLARDYAFTGLGLGNFEEPFPVYALLTWFIISPRTYSILPDVLIQQGVIGLIALLMTWGVSAISGVQALRTASDDQALTIEAGLAGLMVLLINGLLNDPLYGSDSAGLGALLLCVPPALVIAASNLALIRSRVDAAHARRPVVVLVAAVSVALLAVAGASWRSLSAAFLANAGAVEQAKAELRIYNPITFDQPTLDQARQQADLRRAIQKFDLALAADPFNATARQRLAQIALSRGDYATALAQAQAAWDAGHRDPITRMTLADAYVAHGRLTDVATLVQGIGQANRRLSGYGWYRYWSNGDYARAAYAYSAAIAADSTDADSAGRLAEVQKLAQDNK